MQHEDFNDDDFLTKLEAADLPAGAYNHRAHIRTGYLYVERYGFEGAIKRMRETLINFTIAAGAEGKYHETITVAFLALINQRLAEQSYDGWQGFLATNADLLDGAILTKFYDTEVLKSDLARKTFVLGFKSAA